MLIKCLAIDDEPLALEVISEYTSKFPALRLLQTFDDAIYGMEFIKANKIDLLFIDINMPDISGIDFVRSLEEKPMTIFTTAHKKFAIDGFEQDAVDYLLKPIAFERFAKAVHKAQDYYTYKLYPKSESEEVLFVNSEYQKVGIKLADIEYIEGAEDYVKFHLSDKKTIMTLMTLKSLLERLPENKFIRIHRSYVVSSAKIKSVSNRKVKVGPHELPISNSYIQTVNDWMSR